MSVSPQARPGNGNALVHGARSAAQIKPKARANRRRVLRNLGLRAGDLDGLALEYLRLWATGQAQLDLRESGGVDHGKDYWVAYNGTRRALEKFERRLGQLGLDRGRNGGDPVARLHAAFDGKGGDRV